MSADSVLRAAQHDPIGVETIPERFRRAETARGYLDFLRLEAQASVVLTDSGEVQEESTVLGVPGARRPRGTPPTIDT
jgi:predicted glycosyltransferase